MLWELGGEHVTELEQRADSIQVPDAQPRPMAPLDLELSAPVFD